MEYFPRPIERTTEWSYAQLRSLIIDACRESRGGLTKFDDLPDRIDIGTSAKNFGAKALECAQDTQQDPQQRERGLNIVWDRNGQRLLVSSMQTAVVGSSDGVSIPVHNEHASVGMIHSHPDRSPFSSTDVSLFFLQTQEIQHRISVLGTVDGGLRALIATAEMYRVHDPKGMFQWRKVMGRQFLHASRYPVEHDRLIAYMAQQHQFGYYVGDTNGVLRRLRLRS